MHMCAAVSLLIVLNNCFPIVLRPIVADTQKTFTCSKSTMKTVEKGLKHILC